MHGLEEVIRRTLADYGLVAHLRDGVIGVWVGNNKIAALGVRVKRGVTFHGFALNVAPDMRPWSFIVPCGITGGGVTSMALELGYPPPMAEVRQRVVGHFEDLFDVELVPATLCQLREQVGQVQANQRLQFTFPLAEQTDCVTINDERYFRDGVTLWKKMNRYGIGESARG